MADLLNPVIPWSVPVQRNDNFPVKVNHMIVSIGAPAHQNVYAFHHLQHFILLLSLCIMCLLIQILLSGHSILSHGSLPPVDGGSCEIEMSVPPTGVVTPASVNQFVTSSGPPMTIQLDAAIATAGLSKEQAEEIFLLNHKAQKLERKIACKFINLSSQEALFHMGAQATGYEKIACGCPDCATAYYTMMCSKGGEAENLDEAFDCLCQQVGQAWLDTNSILFCHTLEYQNKLNDFFMESEEAIEMLHDRIWTVILKVMEDAGAPVSKGLGIIVYLVDMLPTIPIHLAFYTSTLSLTSFVLEVYAGQPWLRTNVMDLTHMPPLQSDWNALDVLCEEIMNNLTGTSKTAKVAKPMACFSMASLSFVGEKADEVGTSDGPTKSPWASHVPHSPGQHS